MPAYFEQGFFVRVPAWHGLGVVLDNYPGREEAMRLAGHDWDVVELRSFTEYPNEVLIAAGQEPSLSGSGRLKLDKGYVSHNRSDTLALLHKPKDSFERIPNRVGYDFAELLLDEGFQYETGITLKGGAVCAITLLLDEPITITGDNSATLPYLGLSWAHDGSASLKGRSTSVRQVCANTVAASEAEGARLGTDFSIRHTKNWKARVEDAKKAMKGVRKDIETYREAMEEFAAMPVSAADVGLFAQALVLDQTVASVSRYKANVASGQHSVTVQNNVEKATQSVLRLFAESNATIPEAHRRTGYGLHMAGVEYLDHIRRAKSADSKVGRSLLRDEPAKARLPKLIREIAAAAA